ncbi:MAG: S41 family peptidase [Flavobacterium sp.]|nr:S41 family peptidase [Flavobacterium sp.]
MGKYLILSLLLISNTIIAQTKLETNKSKTIHVVKRTEAKIFSFELRKDKYYSIIVEQQGIDVILYLKDNQNKIIKEQDSPNGQIGPEKIVFSPDNSNTFLLHVKPLDEKENSQEGKFSISIKEIPKKLMLFTTQQLNKDFDILKNAFIETKVGLWYNTYPQFDSICKVQRSKIKDKMNALEFYQIVAPLVSFTKEGHSNIRISDDASTYIKQTGKYFPFLVKILNGKVFLINDLNNFNTKGFILTKINNNSVDKILETFLKIEPSDGFNMTSKFKWIETAFSKYYLRFFELNPTFFTIEIENPTTNEKLTYKNIPSYNFKEFSNLLPNLQAKIPNYSFTKPSAFSIKKDINCAILTINDLNTNVFENGRKGFKQYLENSFKEISEKNIQNLIIDLRKCEGGTQGMEDHLLSYLVNKEYQKYKYVEIPGFNYSFIKYSDYNGKEDDLIKDLKTDFYLTTDGRYLTMKGHYEGDSIKPNNFKGNIYILISGLTFSGGSEFASLARNYTNAKFFGEETGGGYYGNTSGSFISYTLPNTQLTGRIPLCKFVVETNKNDIAFGRGLIPDFYVQSTIEDYINGNDTEMDFVIKMISKKLNF